jgi:hypothetical protein
VIRGFGSGPIRSESNGRNDPAEDRYCEEILD